MPLNQETNPIYLFIYPSIYWVSKMVIPVFGASEGEVLSYWIYKSCDEPRSLGAKIKKFRQIPPDGSVRQGR